METMETIRVKEVRRERNLEGKPRPITNLCLLASHSLVDTRFSEISIDIILFRAGQYVRSNVIQLINGLYVEGVLKAPASGR